MPFDAALVRERGVSFAVVSVRSSAVGSESSRQAAVQAFSGEFPGVPIVLMAQEASGRARFWGRPDIVRFLAKVHPARLPWRRYW